MNPRIVKFANSDTLYANRDLIKYAKSCMNTAVDQIDPGDNIFFFNNVEYKRRDIYIAQEKFNRVIKIEKANAVVINRNASIVDATLSFKNGKIDQNCPIDEADDLLCNISKFGSEYVRTMKTFLDLSKLSNVPKMVGGETLLSYVNSGFVLDESSYDAFKEMFKADRNVAYGTLNNVDINQSLPCVLFFLYFDIDSTANSYNRYTHGRYLPNIDRYLTSNLYGSYLNDSQLNILMSNDFVKSKILENIYKNLESMIKNLGNYGKFVENVNIDIALKRFES